MLKSLIAWSVHNRFLVLLAAKHGRQHHVLHRCQRWQQTGELEDKADPLVAQERLFLIGQLPHLDVVQEDLA